MNSNLGKRIEGRYEILELIGVGGMANVYRATDVTDGKTVAVKILREEFSENEEFLRRFKNESKAIALLSHPNIIKVYDVCFSDKLQCIVMEFVDGITLKEYMDSRGRLPYKEALHFIEQIMAALEHAHSRGIVHRDVKPQNVMLLEDGSLKITDFGIARFARSEAKTITDRAIGSVHYISPEQARGGSTDNRTDIYSAGVLLYEMLTGRLPFEGDTPVSVALMHIELTPPGVREAAPDIPEGLEQIVQRAMAKEPDRRYQSAREMADDIAAFKRDPSISFAYKYLSTTDKNDFKRSLMKAQSKKKGAQKPRKKQKKGLLREEGMTPPPPAREKKPMSVIPVLGGITAAFVLVAGVFIAVMVYLNNPFKQVPNVTMPELIGLNYEELKNDPNYSFTFEVEATDYSYNYKEGQIYDQNPKAGRTVKEGARVRVKVSRGPLVVNVPNVVGKPVEEAYRVFDELKLKYRTVEVFSPIYEAGSVAATNPGWGSPVEGNVEVEIHVSMGREDSKPLPVPSLVGLSLDDAKKLVKEMGFNVGNVTYVYTDQPFNTVVAQDPSDDSSMVAGGLIHLNVSYGDNQVKTITLNIALPDHITEQVEMSCLVGGEIVRLDKLTPSEVPYWTPSFEGSKAISVMVMLNGRLYQLWEIDFTTEQATLKENNAPQF